MQNELGVPVVAGYLSARRYGIIECANENTMQVRELLKDLDIGSSVAEFDEALDRYFVETEAFRAPAFDRADLI